MFQLLFTVIATLFFSLHAEKTHALARFGKPKYEKGFSNFSYVNPNAPKGGTLRLSDIGTFDTANPHAIKGNKVIGVLELCFDPLMVRNLEEPFTLYGLVAKYVEVAPDNSKITFYINPKARFHDGKPITAHDVKFTYEYLIEQGPPRFKHYYKKIAKIEIIDDLTITLTLEKDTDGTYNSELPMNLSMMSPLPKHVLEGKELTSFLFDIYTGSGPYKIEKVDQGRSITFVRIPNYWAADLNVRKGANNFERVRIDYYSTTQTQFQAFTAGEFDVFFETNPNNWESGYDFTAMKDGRVTRVDLQHERSVAVRTFLYNMKRPIFADWRVRKALAMAFDFDMLNKMVFANSMQPADSLFANTYLAPKGPASEAEIKILEQFKKDIPEELYETMIKTGFMPVRSKGDGDQREILEKAGKLLDDAGWKIVNGVRRNSKGEPLKLELMYKDAKLEKIILLLKRSLSNLGVELVVRMMDIAQYENRVLDRDFDIIIHTWANGMSPGNEQMFFYSQKSADVVGGTNYMGLKDPIAEQLAINVAETKTQEELADRVHALDRYVMNMYYQIPMYYDNRTRFAYWVNKLAFPEINTKVGLNVMAYAWQPEQAKEEAKQSTGIWARIKAFFGIQ